MVLRVGAGNARPEAAELGDFPAVDLVLRAEARFAAGFVAKRCEDSEEAEERTLFAVLLWEFFDAATFCADAADLAAFLATGLATGLRAAFTSGLRAELATEASLLGAARDATSAFEGAFEGAFLAALAEAFKALELAGLETGFFAAILLEAGLEASLEAGFLAAPFEGLALEGFLAVLLEALLGTAAPRKGRFSAGDLAPAFKREGAAFLAGLAVFLIAIIRSKNDYPCFTGTGCQVSQKICTNRETGAPLTNSVAKFSKLARGKAFRRV